MDYDVTNKHDAMERLDMWDAPDGHGPGPLEPDAKHQRAGPHAAVRGATRDARRFEQNEKVPKD